MCGLGASNPIDPTCGLDGGLLGGSPLNELPFGEFLGCPPSGGWWV